MSIISTLEKVDRVVFRLVSELTLPVLYAALLGAFLLYLAAFIDTVTNQPHGYFLYPSGKCVTFESPDPADSCDQRPAKYVHHWVFDNGQR